MRNTRESYYRRGAHVNTNHAASFGQLFGEQSLHILYSVPVLGTTVILVFPMLRRNTQI